jgi:RimJ/RimL family protein N-acetyltransferase
MSFDLQPRLTGELLELRPLRLADFNALYAAASDPLIWEQHPEDRHLLPVFEKYFESAIASGGAFAIIERATGKIIGSSRYSNLAADESEIEIGWTFLERAFWGGKYNRELKRLMLDHAFRFVPRVVFVVAEDNIRSQKAVEKIGGRLIRKVERPGLEGTKRMNLVFAIDR